MSNATSTPQKLPSVGTATSDAPITPQKTPHTPNKNNAVNTPAKSTGSNASLNRSYSADYHYNPSSASKKHEEFKNQLVHDVFGRENKGKVPMEKVAMLIWQFRDDPAVVQFMAQFVAKVSEL
mmetsp:Transcript_22553/g.46868  ORF Transcript_22553/g.46868 Transcript_22553/m.46868 type:complete len:123 (+) Transcript_22553:269-637(+)